MVLKVSIYLLEFKIVHLAEYQSLKFYVYSDFPSIIRSVCSHVWLEIMNFLTKTWIKFFSYVWMRSNIRQYSIQERCHRKYNLHLKAWWSDACAIANTAESSEFIQTLINPPIKSAYLETLLWTAYSCHKTPPHLPPHRKQEPVLGQRPFFFALRSQSRFLIIILNHCLSSGCKKSLASAENLWKVIPWPHLYATDYKRSEFLSEYSTNLINKTIRVKFTIWFTINTQPSSSNMW